MPNHSKALVTLLIGDAYLGFWKAHCEATWRRYAARHGYDIVIIDTPIDPGPKASERSLHQQKCLILEHPAVRQYEDVVWVDADIVIDDKDAPCIVDANSSDKVGGVTSRDAYATAEKMENRLYRIRALNNLLEIAALADAPFSAVYERAGLLGDVEEMMNTGVLVFKPDHHADVLRTVYETYDQNPFSGFENLPLAHHLLKRDMVNRLDPRFYRLLGEEIVERYLFLMFDELSDDHLIKSLCVYTAFNNAYFLHFIAKDTGGFIHYRVPEATWQTLFSDAKRKIDG
jgi:hypothetical protein